MTEIRPIRWRRINAPHLVPLVRAGARFIDGQRQERSAPLPEDEPIVAEESAAAASPRLVLDT